MRAYMGSFFQALAGKDDGPGAERRAVLFLLLALLAWGAAFSLWADARDLRARRELQKKRFSSLTSVIGEYRALAGTEGRNGSPAGDADGDLLTGVSNVAASLGLRSNLKSIAAQSGRGGGEIVSAALDGLSSEQLAKFIQETERRGIFCSSAEVRAVRNAPSENLPSRSLAVNLILGRNGR
ncbi:MAG: type II secretion system protein GspM [Aminivibrio sp.]